MKVAARHRSASGTVRLSRRVDPASIGIYRSIGLFADAGEDRDLFLPSGLYAREDIPAYLNGELAGE